MSESGRTRWVNWPDELARWTSPANPPDKLAQQIWLLCPDLNLTDNLSMLHSIHISLEMQSFKFILLQSLLYIKNISFFNLHIWQQESTSGIYKALGDKLRQAPASLREAKAGVRFKAMLSSGDTYAYAGALTGTVAKLKASNDCNAVILPETFFPVGVGIALPKGAVYKKYFDKV